MYKILLIVSEPGKGTIWNILQDYPNAKTLEEIPREDYKEECLIFSDIEDRQRELFRFLKKNPENNIYIVTKNPELINYKIRNMCNSL